MKAKLCPVCEIKFKPTKPLQQVCGLKCAIKYNKPKAIKERFKKMKLESARLPELRATARRYFQQYIRLRDKHLPCISCGTTEAKWDGGHYLKAEIYTGLIFDEDNCHKQCAYCNLHLDGNTTEYREGLIKRIGRVGVELLEARKDLARMYKFSPQELVQIAEEYKTKLKEIK